MAEAVVKKIYPERAEAAEAKTAEAKTRPEAPAPRSVDIDRLKKKLPTSRRDRATERRCALACQPSSLRVTPTNRLRPRVSGC